MNYAEATYFDGYHFAHIAARDDANRLSRMAKRAREFERNKPRGLRLRDYLK